MNIRIVVVDNDADGSARPIALEAAQRLRWPLVYSVEPQRGISFARNHAVGLTDGFEYVAFIDDDEFVDATWLLELLQAQKKYDADVVAGRVEPVFESAVPPWVSAGNIFQKRSGATGKQLSSASTANILFRRDVLSWVPGPFDGRFALTGGSDAFLSRQLSRMGARIIWCDEAVVREVVPSSRVSVSWILRRAYRRGNTAALCEQAISPQLRRSLGAICGESITRIWHGFKKVVRSTARGRVDAVWGLSEIAEGCGTMLGLLGHRYEEYRKVHGT